MFRQQQLAVLIMSVTSAAFDCLGKYVVCSAYDGTIPLCDVHGHQTDVAVAATRSGINQFLYILSVSLLRGQTGVFARVRLHQAACSTAGSCIAWPKVEDLIRLGMRGGSICVCDVSTALQNSSLKCPQVESVTKVIVSPDFNS